eukprot:5050282-Pyramimonas_sp.AAC.1
MPSRHTILQSRCESSSRGETRWKPKLEAQASNHGSALLIGDTSVIILLHFTDPPVPITARVHSTPERPFLATRQYIPTASASDWRHISIRYSSSKASRCSDRQIAPTETA